MSPSKFFTAALFVCSLAACADDAPATSNSGATADTTATTEVPTATTAAPAPTTTAAPAEEWETVAAPADCLCSDGSEFSFFVRHGDATRVMFFLQGGGACFDANSCDPASGNYSTEVNGPGALGEGEGIFDFDNSQNPFADYSVVFVPYCTGDVNLGNTVHDYGISDSGANVVIHHNGYVNATTALATLVELFPDATEVVVAGESAGSIGTPLYAGLAQDLLPNARLTVLADGSGAYPDIPVINATIGTVWGTQNAVPDWPENADVTAETWSIPGLFVKAGTHAPAITFARHDYAFDETQVFFGNLAGIAADELVTLIDLNETQIEAAGVVLWSYISPGSEHTVLHKPEFYTETLNGVKLRDWVAALIAGEPVADVHCTTCTTG
ncbi:MAG: hypothetical protein HY826_03410 [Actinobacteria bacterium]|nr:hypothetical protein [Actinomycetota bacterium]